MSHNDDPAPIRFPDFLREARKAAGKTQQDVADHLGVVQSAVSAWEIGRASMPMPVFFRLVQFLELDLAKAMACFVDAPAATADPSAADVESSTGTAGGVDLLRRT